MEGRAIARPNRPCLVHTETVMSASMEGRAIARPNAINGSHLRTMSSALQWRAGQLPGQTCTFPVSGEHPYEASMEGRAIARPNQDDQIDGGEQSKASMEGRAIARPNQSRLSASTPASSSFNGGPGNCPAKHALEPTAAGREPALQWRAGQLPGQTRLTDPHRTIAQRSFNGGPGNCPAKLAHA